MLRRRQEQSPNQQLAKLAPNPVFEELQCRIGVNFVAALSFLVQPLFPWMALSYFKLPLFIRITSGPMEWSVV